MTPATGLFSTHDHPASACRTNARSPEPGRFEQLWTRRIGDSQFEVCRVPFFLYDLALGDIVETAADGERRFVLDRVIRRSGRYVFRAFFERAQYRCRDSTVAAVEALGAQVEWSSPSLLAIDIAGASAQRVADLLLELEQKAHLVYETGKTGNGQLARPKRDQTTNTSRNDPPRLTPSRMLLWGLTLPPASFLALLGMGGVGRLWTLATAIALVAVCAVGDAVLRRRQRRLRRG